MKTTEHYLYEHWRATKRIGKLMLELSLAKKTYEDSCYTVSQINQNKTKSNKLSKASPVEHSAIIAGEQYRSELKKIEQELKAMRRKTTNIEYVVLNADLEIREKEYVQLRYFENRSAEAVASKMFCSPATCRRIRKIALNKIEITLEKLRNNRHEIDDYLEKG